MATGAWRKVSADRDHCRRTAVRDSSRRAVYEESVLVRSAAGFNGGRARVCSNSRTE